MRDPLRRLLRPRGASPGRRRLRSTWYSTRSTACVVACLYEITALENEAAAFAARFWRDFYRSMLTNTARNALTKLLMIALGLLILVPDRVLAADRLNLVVMVDLTESVAAKGQDGKTESEKNFQVVGQLLGQVPAGSHVTVLAITDNSFAQPYILLSAEMGDDEGYFKERLAGAQQQLVHAWQSRVDHLQRGFLHTDVLGALLLADQLFHESSNGHRNVLVILSDMRQNTNDLNLETPATLSVPSALAKAEGKGMIANLGNVEVHVLGVDNARKPVPYWKNLQEFWLAYFRKAGASLHNYTVLRGTPSLEPH
jgi:hypothetical protein